ncbi:hypothetical protein C4J87_3297 [Pseudomonas sp. R1-43-08]|uniref:hypothetical protein n=1 Tax=Pseudomonas sp. R1-43-08 TaxID=1173270 RepID=UPI000F71F4C9|nr:hypothetical protein [Pseudomonas sp. R1-43-08]AZF43448.1 hypothetical protein C4J87_3297 [Pseudomonas sp. R1-43-08]
MTPPSDLKILNAIYKLYYEEFKNFTQAPDVQNGRVSKIYVPINCMVIAKDLNVDSDIVFGRLYYHLEQKYGYKKDDGRVAFFSLGVGSDKHCVNFPLLASVLAGLQEESSKFQWTIVLSGLAVAISIVVPLVTALLDKP